MYISVMTIDANGGNSTEVHAEPTLPRIVEAIRALDGHHRTLIMLEHDEDHWLAIGGGSQGRYVVTVTDDDTFYLAVSSEASVQIVSLVVGGQKAERPLHETSNLASVLLATSAYARDGSLAADLKWVMR